MSDTEDHDDQRGDGVDDGAGAAARHGVDHHGQSFGIDAGHQAGDDVIVEGNGEREQGGGDDAGGERGQGDMPERLPLGWRPGPWRPLRASD